MMSKATVKSHRSAVALLPFTLTFVCASAESLSHQHLHLHPRASNSTWQPSVGSTWQIVLSLAVTEPYPNVQVFDLDLFSNPKATIDSLHEKDIKAICYFSAGSYENWRPDAVDFHPSDYGNKLDGWNGEYWLNTVSTNVRNIMTKRLDLAVTKGCDGVDPDNTDGYTNDSGFDLTEDTAVNYLDFLAQEAHNRGLSIGLKNSGDIIPRVIDQMQWAVNEQCVQYNECNQSRPFIDAGKPVFGIEYPTGAPDLTTSNEDKVCDDSQRAEFSTLLKEMSLNNWYYACSLNASTTSNSSSGSTSFAGRVVPSPSLLGGLGLLGVFLRWMVI